MLGDLADIFFIKLLNSVPHSFLPETDFPRVFFLVVPKLCGSSLWVPDFEKRSQACPLLMRSPAPGLEPPGEGPVPGDGDDMDTGPSGTALGHRRHNEPSSIKATRKPPLHPGFRVRPMPGSTNNLRAGGGGPQTRSIYSAVHHSDSRGSFGPNNRLLGWSTTSR